MSKHLSRRASACGLKKTPALQASMEGKSEVTVSAFLFHDILAVNFRITKFED